MNKFTSGDVIKRLNFDNELTNIYIVQEVDNDGLQFIFTIYSVFENVTLKANGSKLYSYIKISKKELLSSISMYNKNRSEDENTLKIDFNDILIKLNKEKTKEIVCLKMQK
jgi:hypothetical protein